MAGLQGVIGSGGRIRTSDLWVMSVIRSKTISLEITHTYGNPKALRPRAAATHGTHGTRVFHLAMYRMMYIFRSPGTASTSPQSLPELAVIRTAGRRSSGWRENGRGFLVGDAMINGRRRR